MLKFMYNGIKLNGELFKAWYSIGSTRGYAEGTITIYAKDYKSFPQVDGLQVQNNTDSMTDYFEKDRIRVTPDNKFYNEVLAAYNKQEEHRQNKINKRNGITEEVKKVEVIKEVKTEVATAQETIQTEGITVEFNEEKKGIEITFASKELATEEIRNAIKSVGFRWFGKLGKWIARQNNETITLVNELFVKAEEVTTDIEVVDEVVMLEEKELVNAQDFNTIETLRDKYIINWSSIPSEIQEFILSCDRYWIDTQEVLLYQDRKAVASMGISKSGIDVEVNSIGAGDLFQWELYKGFTLNNFIAQAETIDNTKLTIFIEGEGNTPELRTNDIVKATENLNDRVMKEHNCEYGGYSKTWITLTMNDEDYRFRYDIDKTMRLTTNILKFMLEQEQKEFDHTMKNIEDFTWLSPSEYGTKALEIIELLKNLYNENNDIVKIDNDPYQRALNTLEDNNLYEIEADSKTVIADNRYIKNIYCNGLTVVTGLTIKELIAEGQGVDILHLKSLKMSLELFMEGLKKHDLKQIRTLFPTATDKALENIIFMDRLQYELSRANINELVTV
jgi:copper chaperone CopZ